MCIFILRRIHTLIGHKAEISSAQFNFDCSLIATGSMDNTCKIWDRASGLLRIDLETRLQISLPIIKLTMRIMSFMNTL